MEKQKKPPPPPNCLVNMSGAPPMGALLQDYSCPILVYKLPVHHMEPLKPIYTVPLEALLVAVKSPVCVNFKPRFISSYCARERAWVWG